VATVYLTLLCYVVWFLLARSSSILA